MPTKQHGYEGTGHVLRPTNAYGAAHTVRQRAFSARWIATAGFASLCTEVNTLSRNNQSTLTVFDTIFRKLLLYAFALLRFWNMLYERKRSPWTSKMAGDEVRLREQLRPESTSRVAIPASSAPQRALAPAM